jgi:RNA 2',3'-cyclic 3'-phosphodiesterase
MPRLFTAIEIPRGVRQHLALMRAPLPGARWIEAEDMHLTLRFAGDIDARTADEFADLLADIRSPAIAITIKGVGAFGGREPRVLWAGAEAGPELDALYRAIERAARAVGLEADPRGFKPHVTLARMRGARQHVVAQFLEENGDLRMEPFVASEFVLMSARPGSGGPPYGVEVAYPFVGTGGSDAYPESPEEWS